MSRVIFGCHIGGGAWHLVMEGRDATQHLKMHGTTPYPQRIVWPQISK